MHHNLSRKFMDVIYIWKGQTDIRFFKFLKTERLFRMSELQTPLLKEKGAMVHQINVMLRNSLIQIKLVFKYWHFNLLVNVYKKISTRLHGSDQRSIQSNIYTVFNSGQKGHFMNLVYTEDKIPLPNAIKNF